MKEREAKAVDVARIEGRDHQGMRVAMFVNESRLQDVLLQVFASGVFHAQDENGDWTDTPVKYVSTDIQYWSATDDGGVHERSDREWLTRNG